MQQFTPYIGSVEEWELLQRFTPDIGSVEESLQDSFLSALLQGVGEDFPGWGLTRLPVKQAGLSLPDPAISAP